MFRTNTNNNTNHINGWPAKTNGDVNGSTMTTTTAPIRSLREEYFANGNSNTNGDAIKNNNNNNNNNNHHNNNNLNGWPSPPVKSNGNGSTTNTANGYSSPAKTNGSAGLENSNYRNGNGRYSTPYEDDQTTTAPLVNGGKVAAEATEQEPAEEDHLIVHNHQNGNPVGAAAAAPLTPPTSANGHHHLHGNLRLMNGKVNGCLTTNGSAKQSNGNNGAVPSEKECDESDPLTGSLLDTKDTMKRRLDESDDDDGEEARLRKEQAIGGGAGGAHEAAGGDDDDDRICGIGSCRPKWATKLASTKVFMVVFLLAWVLQGMYSTYFVSVITTIEKLFQIQSKVTGVLLSVTEIGQISTALFLTYYAGRGHRPRWIACGKFDGR